MAESESTKNSPKRLFRIAWANTNLKSCLGET